MVSILRRRHMVDIDLTYDIFVEELDEATDGECDLDANDDLQFKS